MANPVSTDERAQIETALRKGDSQNAVARKFGRSPGTVNSIAQSLDLEYTTPKNANESRRQYARQGRIDHFEKILSKSDELLKHCDKPNQLRELATASAICADKLRLDEDRPTSIVEERSTEGGVRARLQRKLSAAILEDEKEENPQPT